MFSKFLADNKKVIRIAVFSIFDAILISFSVYLAFFLRFDGQIPSQHFLNIWGMVFFALIFCLPIFYFFRLYFFVWIYVSAGELISLIKAVSLSFLLLTASIFALRQNELFSGLPRSTIFISYFLVILFTGGLRLSKRIFLQVVSKKTKEGKEKTLIVGAGDSGEQLLRNILSSEENPYLPIGFIDDSPAKQGTLIHGIRVLGKINDIPKVVRVHQIGEGTMIIALPSAGSEAIRKAVEQGRSAGLKKIKIVPPISEIISGKVSLGSLREVQIEDLLGRTPVNFDQRVIEDFIKNKTILITGAAGSIGSELCRQIAKFQPALLLILDQDETGVFTISEELKDKFSRLNFLSFIVDIRDELKIGRIFSKYKPNIVFHAAAYKHVPLMESEPDEAVKNNVFGTELAAKNALKFDAEKFIFISTDKAVRPASVMGATKRVGEMVCQILQKKNKTKFISVRFGNVLASRGSVIPIFEEKIKKREPLKITHPEMKRYFMTSAEACLLVLQASQMGKGGEVFVLDMGKPLRILDLAREMIRLSGLEPDKDIPIVITQPRPGEKFFEDILTAEEGIEATYHQKIFIAKLAKNEINEDELNFKLKKLKIEAETGYPENIKRVLKEIIPTYSKSAAKI